MEFKIGDKIRIVRQFDEYCKPIRDIQEEDGYLTVAGFNIQMEHTGYFITGYGWVGELEKNAELYVRIKKPKEFSLFHYVEREELITKACKIWWD